MDAQTFLDNFATIAEAPGGVQRLRELVLELAVRGQLVDQEPADESAAVLLHGMPARRDALVASGAIGKPRHPEGVAVDDPPHEIPASWAWARLGDVGAVVGGGTPKSGEPAYWADGSDVPWLTPADMRSQASRLISIGARDITARGLAESSAQLLPAGSVLFSSRAPIGHVGIAAQPLATNQGFKSCVPYVGEMTEYLYLFLRYVGPIVDASATGTTFKEVSGKQVALIPVPVPPLAEQERIVAKVDELLGLCDDLEARRERRHRATSRFRASSLHALTEAASPDDLHLAWQRVESNWPAITAASESVGELRQTILQLAFEGRLAGAGAHGRSRPETGPPNLDGPFPIPGHWRWAKFDEVVDSRLGKMLDKAKNTGPLRPYLRNANVQWFRFDLSDVHELRLEDADLETHSLRAGDLVICEGGEPGRLAVCDDTVSGMVFQKALHRARPRSEVDVWYLAYLLRCYAGSGYLTTFFTGATIKHLTGKALGTVPVPLPPIAEQRQIVARIEELTAASDQLEATTRRCAASEAALAAGLTRTA